MENLVSNFLERNEKFYFSNNVHARHVRDTQKLEDSHIETPSQAKKLADFLVAIKEAVDLHKSINHVLTRMARSLNDDRQGENEQIVSSVNLDFSSISAAVQSALNNHR